MFSRLLDIARPHVPRDDSFTKLNRAAFPAKPERYTWRGHYGEYPVFDGGREMAVCGSEDDARGIVDALNAIILLEEQGDFARRIR